MILSRTKVLVLLLLLSVSSFAQSEQKNDRIVRVLTFNIFHGATMKNDFDLDRIAGVINFAKPDLVALQEVDFKTNRSKKLDLVTELAVRTGLSPLFARAMYFDGGEYGEGVLSKFSFVSSRNVALPYAEGKEPRAALEVVVKINEKDTIAFVGTHLDHTQEIYRIPQVKKLNQEFAENTFPTLLAGDLNAEPGSESIEILEKKWATFYDKNDPEITYPTKENGMKLDYIMASPARRWQMIETKVIKDDIASDHYAVLMVLELVGN